MMLNYSLVGAGLAVIIFLAIQGVNVLPFAFFGGLMLTALYVNRGRSKSFAAAEAVQAQDVKFGFDDIGGQNVAKKELNNF
jgi:hypothetical protein